MTYRANTAETIHALQEDIHDTARQKGWYDGTRTIGEEIALMHSELSEALEEVRNDTPPIYYRTVDGEITDLPIEIDGTINKTEGVAAELADTIIRILDTAEGRSLPVADALIHKIEYNKTRGYRHGGKRL